MIIMQSEGSDVVGGGEFDCEFDEQVCIVGSMY
jgi:hypothetical protein